MNPYTYYAEKLKSEKPKYTIEQLSRTPLKTKIIPSIYSIPTDVESAYLRKGVRLVHEDGRHSA